MFLFQPLVIAAGVSHIINIVLCRIKDVDKVHTDFIKKVPPYGGTLLPLLDSGFTGTGFEPATL